MPINFSIGDKVRVNQSYVSNILIDQAINDPVLETLGYMDNEVGTVTNTGSVSGKAFIRILPLNTSNPNYNNGNGAGFFFSDETLLNNSFELSSSFLDSPVSCVGFNNTVSTIGKAKLVYLTGYNNTEQLPNIDLASASSTATSVVLGITTEDIASNKSGNVVIQGSYAGINTFAFSIGDVAYLSNTPGAISTGAGTETVVVGTVIVSSTTQGAITVGLVQANSKGTSGSQTLSQTLGNGNTTGGTSIDVSSGDRIFAVDSANLPLGGTTVATDVGTGSTILQGQNAYPQATVNKVGGNNIIAGGIGQRLYTVTNFAAISGKTVTISVNSSPSVTLTEGVNWTAATSNDATATSLGSAITANGTLGAQLTVTVVSNAVYLTPKLSCYALTIATNAVTGLTDTLKADGILILAGNGLNPQNNLNVTIGFLGPGGIDGYLFEGENGPGTLGFASSEAINVGTPAIQVFADSYSNIISGTNPTFFAQVAYNSNFSTKFEFTASGATTNIGTVDASTVNLIYNSSNVASITSATNLSLGSSVVLNWNNDANLARQNSAGILGLFRDTSGDSAALRIYNTTDNSTTPTNAEWFETSWAANVCTIGTNQSGSGTSRALTVSAPSVTMNAGANTSTLTNILTLLNANGGSFTIGCISNSVTLNTGATSTNLTTAVPAGSAVLIIAARITTTITTATVWSLRDAANGAYINNTTNVTAGFTTTGTLFSGSTNNYTAASTFKITTNVNPGAGVIEVQIYYVTATPPTS